MNEEEQFMAEQEQEYNDKALIAEMEEQEVIYKQQKLIDKMKRFILDKKLMCEFLDLAKEKD